MKMLDVHLVIGIFGSPKGVRIRSLAFQTILDPGELRAALEWGVQHAEVAKLEQGKEKRERAKAAAAAQKERETKAAARAAKRKAVADEREQKAAERRRKAQVRDEAKAERAERIRRRDWLKGAPEVGDPVMYQEKAGGRHRRGKVLSLHNAVDGAPHVRVLGESGARYYPAVQVRRRDTGRDLR